MRARLVFLAAIAALGTAIVAFGQNSAGLASVAKANTPLAPPPTKWDDRVLNTFFPDARQALSGERPQFAAVGANSGGPNSNSAAGTSGKDQEGSNAGNANAWSKLISADTLQDEVKTLSPQLADDVKTQPEFIGGAFKKSRRTLSLLAALFAIVNEYDGDVRWKAQAAAARDLFAHAGFDCKAATLQTFKEAKARSDDLKSLLRGESITPPAEVQSATEWSKVANLSPLMSRLELAQRDHIAAWTSDAGEMRKNAAGLAHEAEVVAALAQVVAQPGFDNSDDEKYRGFAKSLQQSAIELHEAVKKSDYAAANQAAGTLSKACANCHAAFRD